MSTEDENHVIDDDPDSEAAYLAAFGGEESANDKPEPSPEVNTESSDNQEVSETKEVADIPEDKPVVPEQESLESKFDRLINERIAQAKQEWIETYNQREQKITGKMGEINQNVLTLKAARNKFDPSALKFQKLAELLGEDTSEALVKDFSDAFKPDIEEDNSLNQIKSDLEMQQIKTLIAFRHKDWEQVVDSNDFAQWRDKLSPEIRADVLSTNDPVKVSDYLDEFKRFDKVSKDPSYINWVKEAGVQLPSEVAINTFESWKLLGSEPGFAEWAGSINDDATRYRIGRESDPEFIAQAANAFAGFKKSVPKTEVKEVVKPKAQTRLAATVVPNTISEGNANSSDSELDAYLAAFQT